MGQDVMNMENGSKNDESISGRKFLLKSENDVVEIREYGRKLAKENGFKMIDQTIITAAISEICSNVIKYAERGEVLINAQENGQKCLRIVVKDKGPGITNIEEILKEGFSSTEGFNIGLSGTERLMDEFNIKSGSGQGTTVEMCKYLEY